MGRVREGRRSQDAFTSPPDSLLFATASCSSQFPLPRADELYIHWCAHTEIMQRRRKKKKRATEQNPSNASFILFSRTHFLSSTILLFAKQNQDQRFTGPYNTGAGAWNYSPGEAHRHGWCYKKAEQGLTSPNSHVPAPIGSRGAGECPRHPIALHANGLSSASNQKLEGRKTTPLSTDAKQHFSMFSWQEIAKQTSQRGKSVCLRSDWTVPLSLLTLLLTKAGLLWIPGTE